MASSDGSLRSARSLAGTMLFAVLLLAGGRAWAQDRVPALVDLPEVVGVDGSPFDLAATIEGSRVTVLVWIATRCPCVARYQDRVEAIAQRYADDGVTVLAIGSNADDSLSGLVSTAAANGFDVPIVHDPNGELARLFNARSTPTVVALDPEGEVIFHGWIDNEREPGERGREAWLENTLDAELAGTLSGPVTAPHWGCSITRRRGQR